MWNKSIGILVKKAYLNYMSDAAVYVHCDL
jgi:hypothetical protein